MNNIAVQFGYVDVEYVIFILGLLNYFSMRKEKGSNVRL